MSSEGDDWTARGPEPVRGDEWFSAPSCSRAPSRRARASKGEEHTVLSDVLGSRWAGRPTWIDGLWMARALKAERLGGKERRAVREFAQCLDAGEDQPNELLAIIGDERLTVRQVASVFREAGVTNPVLTHWINARGEEPDGSEDGWEGVRAYARAVLRGDSERRNVGWKGWPADARVVLAEDLRLGLGEAATSEALAVLGRLCQDESREVRKKAQAWCTDPTLPDETYVLMLSAETRPRRLDAYWTAWWRGYVEAKTAGAPRRGPEVARALEVCLGECRDRETARAIAEELQALAGEQDLAGAHARRALHRRTEGGEAPSERFTPVQQRERHWVPKSVQEAWTEQGQGRKLLLGKGQVVPYAPKSSWREKHFYVESTLEGEESVEGVLATVEGAWSNIRRDIARRRKTPPKGHNDYEWMVMSVVVQVMRTEHGGVPATIRNVQEQVVRAVGRHLEESGKLEEAFPGHSFLDDSIRVEVERRQAREQAVIAAATAANAAYDLDAGILYSKAGRILLPDCGAWRENPWADSWGIPWGWGSIGACAVSPVSPNECLVLYDGEIYEWGGGSRRGQRKKLTPEEERRLGWAAARAAGTEVVCSPRAEEWMMEQYRSGWGQGSAKDAARCKIPGLKTPGRGAQRLTRAVEAPGARLYGIPARPSSTASWE